MTLTTMLDIHEAQAHLLERIARRWRRAVGERPVGQAPPKWGARYPDRDRLRLEAECLAECFRDQLLAQIPAGEIRAIYLKGSAVKRWESPLDYVPEVSDVDMHVWFHDDAAWPRHLGTVSQALEVQKGVEVRFAARISRPLHEPRPQLIVMNKMMVEHEGFLHSPRSTVSVLYGEEYPEAGYGDSAGIMRHDATQLVSEAEWVDAMPLHLVDRPGRYLRDALRQLVWRVSPAGPRVLHVSGLDAEQAWSMNRTRVTLALRDLGMAGLADAYVAFYLSSWDYFLSGFIDSDAGRSAIQAAAQVLTESAEIGRQWLTANPL